MKVNRFGMSQKIFEKMVLIWALEEITKANLLFSLSNRAMFDWTRITKIITETRDVLNKTFLELTAEVQEHLDALDILEMRINRESSAQAEASVLSS